MTAERGGRIPRHERLHKSDEIRSLRESGVRIRGELITLYLAPAEAYKFGVVASRRIGIAVQRNRARRVIREALRSLRARFPSDRPARLLIAAKPGVVRAKAQEVAVELNALLEAHGVFV